MPNKPKKKRNYNDGTTINTRAYSFDFVIYEITADYLQERLDILTAKGIVKHYAYIIHEHDTENVVKREKVVNDDGSTSVKETITDEIKPKPIHAHLLCVFNQHISVKQFKERLLIYTEHNTFGQPLKDKRGAYRYLIHKDDPEKYQYDENDIIVNDDYFSKEDLLINPNKEYLEIMQMFDDYKHLSHLDMAIKYGKDYIKNYNSYSGYFDICINDEKYINLKVLNNDMKGEKTNEGN